MKRLLTLLMCFVAIAAVAQEDTGELQKYRRSSLYTVLIKHSQLPYGTTIDSAFMQMPLPDKFNDHNLALRSFESSAKRIKKAANNKKKDAVNEADIKSFIEANNIAKMMVAKWFNRNAETGICDMNLVSERGNYDASQVDIALAEQSIRGRAMLADAGEELIGNTFLLVNDITFRDKGEGSEKAAIGIAILGGIAGAVLGSDLVSDAGSAIAAGVNEIDGFQVNITSYLYRLVWNEELLWDFYTRFYADESYDDQQRIANRDAFNAISGNDPLYQLEFVGKTTTHAGNLQSKSFSKYSKLEQMTKVCTRAIDKAIVELQREYDEFKVNVPIYEINDDGTVTVQIGLKEGINKKSRFDVLMPIEDEDGRIHYEKVGKIRPIEGQIWDNRFGALEDAKALEEDPDAKVDEESKEGNAYLNATTFNIISGGNRIMKGCLVREETIKVQ